MRPGWEGPGNDVRAEYSRVIKVGPLRLTMDVWQYSENEWAYALQGRNAEHPEVKTADKAMAAAELLMRGYLRVAARQLK
jgi:hypothetical protein